nr:hypothetical protein [Tanacetum cinerariifolium]
RTGATLPPSASSRTTIRDIYGFRMSLTVECLVKVEYKNKIKFRPVSKQSKAKAYEELYKRLDSKEGANDIYKIAKARERRRRDIGSMRYIKDEGGRTIVREDDIKKIWGEYFSSLFNETPADESRRDESGEVESSSLHRHFDCYYSRINQGEVRVALQKMGRNKVVGPDQIPIEAWKCLEEEGVQWLNSIFNKIFPSAKMPNELRLSEVIPIYKNKGDAQACSNYRGIKLLSHTMKLWERVIAKRVRRETRVSENQFGFMPKRSTIEVIHLLRSLIEKYRKRQRDLHMTFLDLKNAYDSVTHELVWKTLIDKGTPSRYLKVIQDMYEGAKTRVRTIVGNTEFFPVENIPWCMIFAEDIMLIAESAKGLNNRLERWKEALEDNGLRVSREQTKYFRCDFGRFEVAHQEVDIRIGDQILQPNESFRYLGSMIHRSERIDEDVVHRIRTGWVKWRAVSGVLCDRRISLKLKGNFYRVAIRPAMLYGSECWPITKAQANRVEVAELRMLRWTCGKTMVDMIPNRVFRAELGVDSIIDEMREGMLRWFGHDHKLPQLRELKRY